MELWHHGVKGQKWGVRRYQNPDGSLTKEGKERYSGKFEETSKAYQDWFEKRMDLQRFKDKNIKEAYVKGGYNPILYGKGKDQKIYEEMSKNTAIAARKVETLLKDLYDEGFDSFIFNNDWTNDGKAYVEMQLKLGNESIFNKKVYMPKYDS